MATDVTFLAPGQRYVRADLAGWRADQQITIVQVQLGADRLMHVTYTCPSGRQVRGHAAEFEVAVAIGELVPVTGFGQAARC